MNPSIILKHPPSPSSEKSKNYQLAWCKAPSLKEQDDILALTNLILAREDTIGFSKPLTLEEGGSLIQTLCEDVLHQRKHLLLGYHETGELIAHLILAPHSLPNCSHRAEILRAMIHPSYRFLSLSIIKGFFLNLFEKCDQLGVCVLDIDVRAHTPISKLWQRSGFELIGTHPHYVRLNGQVYPGFYMTQSVEILKKKWLKT